jgi:hypothetical protein
MVFMFIALQLDIPYCLRSQAVELQLRIARAAEEEIITKSEMSQLYTYYSDLHSELAKAVDNDDGNKTLLAGQRSLLLQKLLTAERTCSKLFRILHSYVAVQEIKEYFTADTGESVQSEETVTAEVDLEEVLDLADLVKYVDDDANNDRY